MNINTPDFVIKSLTYNFLEQVDILNKEFLDYLSEVNDLPINEAETNGQLDWFIKWKSDKIAQFNNNINILKSYTNNDVLQKINFLKTNQAIILNIAEYPVKQDMKVDQCPDYNKAMSRLKDNLGSGAAGTDLSKFNINDPQGNLWFKQQVIKGYKPVNNKENFGVSCRNYYMGADHMMSMSSKQIQTLLRPFYNYCNTFVSYSHQLTTQASNITSFIQKDPVTGVAMNNNQQAVNAINNKPTGMASTNPNSNVNASYTFNDMIEEYGLLLEINTVGNAGTGGTPNSVTQTQPANTGTNPNTVGKPNISTPKNNSNNQLKGPATNKSSQLNNNTQNQGDNRLTMSKKTQIAGDILVDAMNGKMTAAIKIFNQLMNVITTHVESYSNNKKG